MIYSLAALFIGFIIDLLVGDPHGLPHPVVLIGKLIAALERSSAPCSPKRRAVKTWPAQRCGS